MNKKSSFLKPLSLILLSGLLTLNFLILSGSSAKASEEEGGGNCKWSPAVCPGGQIQREICLSDGTGNSCQCGSVTRPCE